MGYACRILLDSITDAGHRLTTFEGTFPRIVLAEVNTHRQLSRNSASSRAIPVEKRLAAIEADPFMPEQFGKNKKGMQHEEVLHEEDDRLARSCWNQSRLHAMDSARTLAKIGVHKQLANRLLEPFSWHTAVISATDWDNYEHLRVNPAAQGEFMKFAAMMQELRRKSIPSRAAEGYWHLPYVYGPSGQPIHPGDIDWAQNTFGESWLLALTKVSAARCARVSYLTQNNERDPAEDLALFDRLVTPGHLSPLEHVARPMEKWELAATRQWDVYVRIDGVERFIRTSVPWRELRAGHEDFELLGTPPVEVNYLGNYNGWVQLRKLIPGEHDILGFRNNVPLV